MSYLTEAEEIHAEYKSRTRHVSIPFQDAAIALLFLIVRLMIERRDRETPSAVAKETKKAK